MDVAGLGGLGLPHVILGCQPFLGESYQGSERNREYAERFSNKGNVTPLLLKAARTYGVRALAAVPVDSNPLSRSYLAAVAEAEQSLGVEFSLAPCFSIPLTIDGRRVDDYRRWLTYYAYEEKRAAIDLKHKFLSDPILLTRPGWRENFTRVLAEGRPYGGEELERLTVDFPALERSVSQFAGRRTLFAEAGSETDFLAVTGRFDELRRLVDFLRGRGFAQVFFGVHHAGVTIPLLENSGLRFDGYVTPVNRLGALMFPDREAALKAVTSTRRRVVAMKTMAGGRLPPRESFEYVFREVGLRSCMIGVGSIEELDIDMAAAAQVISLLEAMPLDAACSARRGSPEVSAV
ncbi:MAG: hypothetical protein QW587_03535 [Candidatus Bathyarchaeia archaeon]